MYLSIIPFNCLYIYAKLEEFNISRDILARKNNKSEKNVLIY